MSQFPTLSETVRALRAGETTGLALTEGVLRRARELNPHLGAFVHLAEEGALASAARADERLESWRRSQGESENDTESHSNSSPPPLLGVPLSLKDGHDVAGMPTTWGTLTSRDASGEVLPARESDALASTLEAAGGVLIGKTQVPEFLLNSYSENRMFPPARNPFALECSPGGSSGGQAAAVAAGILPAAIGSDGGGSIRIPSAACGLIGLKPNRGRVPSSDAMGDVGQLGVNGPIARTAQDTALLLDVLCHTPGHDAIDRPVRAVPVAAAARDGSYGAVVTRALAGELPWGARPLRIGVSTVSPFDETYEITVSPTAQRALADGIAQLTALGHDVVEAPIHYDPGYPEAFASVWTTVTGQLPVAGREDELTGLTRSFRERALRRTAVQLADAVRALREIERESIEQFGRYDMVLTPALAMPPRPVGWYHEGHDIADPAGAEQDYRRQCQYTPWTSVVNVVGLPAITVPTGWYRPDPAEGDYPGPVPMGVQLIAAPSAEAWLLALAAQLAPPTSPAARLVA